MISANNIPQTLLLLSPHVTLLPGDDVENGGDEEQGAQSHAVDPGREPLPAVIGHVVKEGRAHERRRDEELRSQPGHVNAHSQKIIIIIKPLNTTKFSVALSCVSK